MSELPDIIVLSRREASNFLMSSEATTLSYLISIGDPADPHERLPSGFGRVARRIRLEFSDVLYEDDYTAGDISEVKGPYDCRPTESDISKLIEFCGRVDGRVLIHCFAGMSRSPAAACILASVKLGPGREKEAMQAIKAVRGGSPNNRMIKIADKLLNRDGAMVSALREVFHSDPGKVS